MFKVLSIASHYFSHLSGNWWIPSRKKAGSLAAIHSSIHFLTSEEIMIRRSNVWDISVGSDVDLHAASPVAQNKQGRGQDLASKQLRILQCNINGLCSTATKIKLEEIMEIAEKQKIQIIALQETKLNEKYNLKYKNYNILRKDRNKEGGGLAFLIKNLYYEDIAINIPNTSDLEAQGIKVYLSQNKTINIFNMYHPPNNKLIDDGTMAQFLTDNTIIVGDLNAKHQLWGCSMPNPRGKILSNIFDDNAFMCLNDGNPTHHSYSYNTAQALDISFSSPDIFHKCKWQILKSIGSDHLPILIEISTKTKTSSIKEKFWNFKKANWNLYQKNTNEDFRKAPTRIKDLEQNWISFKNTIIKAAKVSIPRGNIKKWIPNYTHQAKDIQTLITKRNELQKKCTQNQTNCRTELNIVNAKIKSTHNIFHEKINMKELDYALENTDLNKTPGPDGIHGQMISNLGKNGKEILLDIFNNSWKTGKLPQDWKTATIIPIKKLDKSADDPKNYRPISLTSICCKLMEKIILRRLTYHLDTRNLLPEEQYGFRKGHGTIDQLLFFTQKEDSNMDCDLDRNGHGGGSCDRRLVSSSDNTPYCILCAFDNVLHSSILRALRKSDCPKNVHDLIRSFLAHRSVRLSVNGCTVTRRVSKGCPQGSVLGPFLWNIVFDELLTLGYKNSVFPQAYADDLVVVISGLRHGQLSKAQHAIDLISDWCGLHKLELSVSKCQAMFVQKPLGRIRVLRRDLVSNGQVVQWCDSIRVLGVSNIPELPPEVTYYTDGSKTNDGVGAVFQAEAFGLIKALENASELPIDTTVEVLLDNLSVVNSVLNCRTGNFLINRALLLISQLNRNGNRCSIRWIKGHSGIVGNDVADALAKSGAGSDLPSCYRLAPLSKLESTARKLAWAAWQSRFSSTTRPICTRFGLTPMSLLDKKYAFIVPSVHAVVGLLSGHTWTDSFSHKMGFIDDPTCPYCDSGAEETLEHILLECDSLDSLRTRLLFIAGKELGHTPRSLRDFIHSKSTWHACVDFLLASDRLKPRIREEDSEEVSDSVSS
ncbi:hypothetical protein LAZ67_6002944 [Cordylochernes scorpioides]|uniref:Reverse transcriptase n=1 Tax=Cordylochernes scorpioides TaxID=51811 RepID=A0ABY6KQ51_9ARAC|nr:hypothetical protein LAZ67_6002944 [Cordylochernes scorpioides]